MACKHNLSSNKVLVHAFSDSFNVSTAFSAHDSSVLSLVFNEDPVKLSNWSESYLNEHLSMTWLVNVSITAKLGRTALDKDLVNLRLEMLRLH